MNALWNKDKDGVNIQGDLRICKMYVAYSPDRVNHIVCPVNLSSTESELYFMLPIFYVSNISLGLTFSDVTLILNKSICITVKKTMLCYVMFIRYCLQSFYKNLNVSNVSKVEQVSNMLETTLKERCPNKLCVKHLRKVSSITIFTHQSNIKKTNK